MAIDKGQSTILASYLSGHLTEVEKASVENWIDANEDNKATFLEMKKIWENAAIRLSYPPINESQFLQEVKSRIKSGARRGRLVSLLDRPVWRIAASLTLILTLYFTVRWFTRENITVRSGKEVATLYLPDSSKVWLNINSEITFSRNFRSREVTLAGEAFFSVKKDTTDFTVMVLNTATRVLGTAFNLRSQPDSSVTLTVAEGNVMFSIDSTERQAVMVNEGYRANYQPQKGLDKKKNDNPSFMLWREQNNPAFENEKANPTDFLSNTFTWRKNQINQTVIEGALQNNATLAAYSKIVLTVTYTKEDGSDVTVELGIPGAVYPGKKLPYRRRLLDILTDTRSVRAQLKSAETTSNKSY
jgi:transmembrane sensor